MSRKKAVWYLVIASVGVVSVMLCLALLNLGAALALLFVGILVLGTLKSRYPEKFKLPPKENETDAGTRRGSDPSLNGQREKVYVPHLALVSANATQPIEINAAKPEFVVGRSPACDYVLDMDARIGRKHFTIRYDERRKVSVIVDNGSKNGTFLNDERLSPGAETTLREGDIVQVAGLRFVVQQMHY